MPQPLPQLLFGPTLDTVLDLPYPLDNLVTYAEPRGSETAQYPSGTEDSWYQGTDYYLEGDARWLPLGDLNVGYVLPQPFSAWENFLAWGRQRQPQRIRYVPDRTFPTNYMDGWLIEPFNTSLGTERDGFYSPHLKLRSRDRHYGIAQRGLFYEYGPGTDLNNPLAHTFTRASVGYRLGAYGYLVQEASGVICDKHYSSGLQTTLLEDAVGNDIPNPEDLTAASWTKTLLTVSANVAKAPDQNVTADLLVESSDVSAQFHSCNLTTAITVTAGDPITALGFLRSGGRYRGTFRVSNVANDHIIGVNYDLRAGTVTPITAGTGAVVAASTIVPLANGWYMIWFRGVLDNASASYVLKLFTQDASGNNSYIGDGASGVYYWGATAVHGTVRKQVASYTPTSSVADVLTAPWNYAPQAQWDYVKYVDWCPDTDGTQTYSILQTGDTGFGATRAYIVKSALTFTGLHSSNSGTVQANAVVGALNPGDIVEVLRVLDATGAVTLRVSVNGGPEVVAGPSGPLAFQPAWTSPILSIGNIGGLRAYMGLNRIKSGPYGGAQPVNSLALARVV